MSKYVSNDANIAKKDSQIILAFVSQLQALEEKFKPTTELLNNASFQVKRLPS